MRTRTKSTWVVIWVMTAMVGCGPSDQKQDELTVDVQRPAGKSKENTSVDPADNQAAADAYNRIKASYDQNVAELKQEVAAAETVEREYEIFEEKNPLPGYIDQLMTLARQYPQTQTGVHAALEAVSRSKGDGKDVAMNFLIENFAARLNYKKMITSFHKDVPSQQIENWIRKMVEFAPEGPRKARAILGFARYVDQIPAYSAAFIKNPHVLAKLPGEQQQYLKSDRHVQLQSEIELLLQTVIDNDPDKTDDKDQSFADLARKELYELQNLSIGKVAPDIVGRDLDGNDFKLSDYRGKVVMLDFWGHWCPPCRAMYSQEQALVETLGSKPFVLIGVNSDRSLDVARNAVRDEGLPWRHFWNGPKGTAGPIAEQWNVEAWPTVYLIDGDGVIRYKDILGEDLDRAIETLLAEAGHDVDLSQLN